MATNDLFLLTLRDNLKRLCEGSFKPIASEGSASELEYEIVEQYNRLVAMLDELTQFSRALSRGDLLVMPPGRKNYIAAGIKSLHAQLNHISWQASQISAGDYAQSLDFMGELSGAFNRMTEQIKRRERHFLDHQRAIIRVLDSMSALVIVIDPDGRSLFANSAMKEHLGTGQEFPLHELAGLVESDTDEWHEAASDCWFKLEITPIEWESDTTSNLVILTDVTQAKRQESTLREKADFDPMTKAYRRPAGMDAFERMRQNMSEDATYLVCFADLDNLKTINDNYGHKAGDVMIIAVSQILHKCTRDSDLRIRVGGDEFMAILFNFTPAMIPQFKDRIENECAAFNAAHPEHPYKLSISLGFSQPAKRDDDVNQIIEVADKDMYIAKRARKQMAGAAPCVHAAAK